MLHLAQVGFFKPIIDSLLGSGYSTYAIFRSSELSSYNIDNIGSYVPLASLCSFLEKTARRHGLNGFLEQFGHLMTLDKIPDFSHIIFDSPDLMTTCRKAADNSDIVFTNEKAVFHINGAQTTWGSCFYDNHTSGHIHIEALNLALIINSFRELIHADWNPLEIHLQLKSIESIESLLTDGHSTEVYFGQPFTGVVFPTELLSRPLAVNGRYTSQKVMWQNSGNSFTFKINRLLDSNIMSLIPNVEYYAALADMNVRTLQRKLAAEGTTFSAIVDRWRFKKAIEMLSNPKLLLKDVYGHLGYSDISNFERAFRRWTKTTPGKYRDNLTN